MKNKVFILLFVIVLVLPWPSGAINALLGLNFFLAAALLLAAHFCKDIRFSRYFPGALLTIHLSMLAVNVNATRVILQGHGLSIRIIEYLGTAIVGNKPVWGLVLFSLIILQQFIVNNKAGEKITKISDSVIAEPEIGISKALHADFCLEMKAYVVFAKNSTLANILIAIINLLGGILISTNLHGLELTTAFHAYTTTTVGIGLATLIQALILDITTWLFIPAIKANNQTSR